jgi:hypothetical protein
VARDARAGGARPVSAAAFLELLAR